MALASLLLGRQLHKISLKFLRQQAAGSILLRRRHVLESPHKATATRPPVTCFEQAVRATPQALPLAPAHPQGLPILSKGASLAITALASLCSTCLLCNNLLHVHGHFPAELLPPSKWGSLSTDAGEACNIKGSSNSCCRGIFLRRTTHVTTFEVSEAYCLWKHALQDCPASGFLCTSCSSMASKSASKLSAALS